MCIVILKLKQLFAHIGVHTKRALNIVFRFQPCYLKKQLSLLSFIMFISLKLEQMVYFVLKVRLKRRSQKERHKRERERGAITPYIQFFICLCSSVSSYNLK